MSNVIKIVCGWCSRVLREGSSPVSHGICQSCELKAFPDETVAATEAEPRPMMSCGHRATTITCDTLAPYCEDCHNVETMVDDETPNRINS
jgi:hypothetical protein